MVHRSAFRKVFSHQTSDLECVAGSSNTVWNPPTIFRPGLTATVQQRFPPLSCVQLSQESLLFLNDDVLTSNDSKTILHGLYRIQRNCQYK